MYDRFLRIGNHVGGSGTDGAGVLWASNLIQSTGTSSSNDGSS